MFKKRIVACLDIKESKVVKGVNFVDLTDIGDPYLYAIEYEDQGADEIVLLFIDGKIDFDLINSIASVMSIPVTVGGGIRSMDDVRKVIESGASRISINTAAVENPDLIRKASAEIGSHNVIVAIDGKKVTGEPIVFTKGGQNNTGINLVEWAKKCQDLGAGEILLTSMDKDGTNSGYDIEMTNAVCEAVTITVVASGGCGSADDVAEVFSKTTCDAALVAGVLHYGTTTISKIRARINEEG